ncbi:MAG: S41 family peptidase [Bacteroidota bacterium]
MKKLIQFVLTFCCIFVGNVAFSQQKTTYDIAYKFSVAELKADLVTLKTQLEKVHTGLYVYHTKAEFDAYFQQLENSITEPMTDIEFHRLTFPLNKLIANGHTRPIPSIGYMDGVLFEWKIFPFEVYVDAGNLYVLKNLSDDETIVDGAIIHSINGENAMAIYDSFVDQIWRDGFNKTAPQTDGYESFSEWYAYLKGLPQTFEVELLQPNGEHLYLSLAAKSMEEMKTVKKERYPNAKIDWEDDPTIKALALEIDGQTATMTIRSWSEYDYKKKGQKKFKQFFKQSFEAMEQAEVEHLILDFRDNGGGDPVPTIELFAHLHPEPFTFYKAITSNIGKIEDNELYNISWFYRTMYKAGFKKEGDKYSINWIANLFGIKGLKPSKPNKTIYDGKVYILTNADCFSATGEMTSILKSYDRGVFIGEEPGGNPNTNTSGLQAVMTLPNTGNRVVMPFWQWEMNTTFENTGYGVKPDYPVRPTIQDMLDGRDVVMEFTLDLIQKQAATKATSEKEILTKQ